jgi:hypothetical protein
MTLQEFKDVLLTVTDKVYHLEAWQESEEYMVWQELQPKSQHGDNGRGEVVQRVQVELFTKKEFTPTLDKLIEVLEKNDIAFEEPIPDYDSNEKTMRYIIRCEVV